MTQDCNTCKETKPLEMYHLSSSRKGRRPRCRACYSRNQPIRIRCRTTPRTVPCGVAECKNMYITEKGAKQHRIFAHSVYTSPRLGSLRDLTAKETGGLETIRRRAVRGPGEGNIDSAGLLDLLFVVGRKRVAA